MLLVASVPVLAQQEETRRPALVPAPVPAPAGITDRCQMLLEDFAALCSVDTNGEITLPARITVARFFVVLGGFA